MKRIAWLVPILLLTSWVAYAYQTKGGIGAQVLGPDRITSEDTILITSDQTSSSTTAAQLGSLTFPMLANTTYQFEVKGQFVTDATTTGIKFQIDGPAAPTRVALTRWVRATSTAQDFQSAYLTGNATTQGPDQERFFQLRGFVVNGANAGDFKIMFASEVASPAYATVLPGTQLKYRRMN